VLTQIKTLTTTVTKNVLLTHKSQTCLALK